ncbi:MAG: hypothetical protein ABF289_01325 [Clostridiales bacterium]
MCKCGFNNINGSKFCSNCGEKIKNNFDNSYSILPKMLSVKETYEQVFNKKISLATIYNLIRTRSIPHCKVNERILLDKDKIIEWWHKKLNDSTKPITLKDLRKII